MSILDDVIVVLTWVVVVCFIAILVLLVIAMILGFIIWGLSLASGIRGQAVQIFAALKDVQSPIQSTPQEPRQRQGEFEAGSQDAGGMEPS